VFGVYRVNPSIYRAYVKYITENLLCGSVGIGLKNWGVKCGNV